ncbi:hypothetical protein TCAL_08879 [Tigriopus californicus]|uniref:Uncharacterized protein n=1 Tax=Tigriopus californicus TaxID=6832 RepID=A0A553N914_TIGCA|nr:hypothetical protein TCAL_08879 [Tigriopus californicus]
MRGQKSNKSRRMGITWKSLEGITYPPPKRQHANMCDWDGATSTLAMRGTTNCITMFIRNLATWQQVTTNNFPAKSGLFLKTSGLSNPDDCAPHYSAQSSSWSQALAPRILESSSPRPRPEYV